jgi:hypothetical protein
MSLDDLLPIELERDKQVILSFMSGTNQSILEGVQNRYIIVYTEKNEEGEISRKTLLGVEDRPSNIFNRIKQLKSKWNKGQIISFYYPEKDEHYIFSAA